MQGFHEVLAVAAVLYTRNTRTTGRLRSTQVRLFDALNAFEQDFLLLQETTFQTLETAEEDAFVASSLLLRKSDIVLGVPGDGAASTEPSAAGEFSPQRVPTRVLVEAWPFIVEGTLYLSPGADLLQYVDDRHLFMPVANATVIFHPRPQLNFDAPLVLVNRQSIQVVLDASEVAVLAAPAAVPAGTSSAVLEPAPLAGDPADPETFAPAPAATRFEVGETALEVRSAAADPVEEAVAEAPAMDGAQAAEVLAATAMFHRVDQALLQEACAELWEARQLGPTRCRAGDEVVRQGEVGEVLYVVELGRLAAYARGANDRKERHVEDFGPGDFFGEIAILGEDRSTATVRALTDASLLTIHEAAMQILMRRFPSAATSMLATMIRRQARRLAP